jgi:hypothetical protein
MESASFVLDFFRKTNHITKWCFLSSPFHGLFIFLGLDGLYSTALAFARLVLPPSFASLTATQAPLSVAHF